jgi:tRNA (cytidine/uridine-2'-O-)-methyltransferase
MYLAAQNPFAIVLVEPQIPQNTGNILRLCACTGTTLYLVGALGFQLGDKFLKRAGMDYALNVPFEHFWDFETLQAKLSGWHFVYASTKAHQSHWQVDYPPQTALVFGSETTGLPEPWLEANKNQCIRIPMVADTRSLNLANSVSIVLYEALRQQH